MEIIGYVGLHPQTLQFLQQHVPQLEITFQEVGESEWEQALSQSERYGAMLVGEAAQNPIGLVQQVYRTDKHLSVLVIADKPDLPKLKQALQFSPFVGPTVRSASNEAGENLVNVLNDVRQRTWQRRSYAKTKTISLPITDFSGSLFEQIKADFMGRVLEEAPIGAMLLTQKGRVLTINPFALTMFRKTEHEVINQPFVQLFPEPLQVSVSQFLLHDYQSNPKKEFDLSTPQKEKHLEISLASISKDDRSSHLICILNDISHIVQAKQLAEAHVQEVEAINSDLQRTNSDLDTFLYAASHDLKSPILNIEGLVAMLDEELEEPTLSVRTALDMISNAVNRFKQTLADMSEVVKTQKEMYNEVSSLNVAELVEEIKESIRGEIKQSEAVVMVDASEAPHITLSKSNLKSILYNLISNAIKYRSPDRFPLIFIKTALKQGNSICLSVTDNGLGIPEDRQNQVFGMFKRLHSHVEGTGMGLHIVKRIVDKEGGQIKIRSEVGQGTTFEIVLPQ